MRPVLILLAVLLLGGCALPPDESTRLRFASRDHAFIDEVLDGRAGSAPARGVHGWFMEPAADSADNPWPAVVVLHSSIGQGSQDWHYARLLRTAGFAVLAIDSFAPRGVSKTMKDQRAVTESSMLADAYAALAALASDPRIDRERIALLGFSKGGIVALYAGLERVRAALAPGDLRFAAHVAYYPWCGLRLRDPRTTGAPLLVHLGGDDLVAPAALCAELRREILAADPAARIDLVVHPDSLHAFDHPLLASFGRLPVGGSVPSDCVLRETAPASFVEEHSGEAASAGNLRALLAACGRRDARAGGNEAAALTAEQQTLGFLRSHLIAE